MGKRLMAWEANMAMGRVEAALEGWTWAGRAGGTLRALTGSQN